MKTQKIFSILPVLLLSILLSAHAHAQEIAPEAKLPSVTVSDDMTEGEIRKIDKANNKITIKHGEIKNLDMPGMTMVFQVKEPAMLETVKTGDKVKFKVEKAGGALVITSIQTLK